MDTHHSGETAEVIGTFNDIVEAGVAQEKLKEAGIESFVHDENVLGMNPLGGVKLKVFSKNLELAKRFYRMDNKIQVMKSVYSSLLVYVSF
ncbi:MAG: DUF2007 domain-containing protein [Chitinophagaceae bacterium]|nr:DUF2007 domain-containing protein [Chitinophagaceae bacterium]